MRDLIITGMCGAGAAIAMLFILRVASTAARVKFDPILALGSLFPTKSPKLMGFLLHLVAGAIFAYFYVVLWGLLGLPRNSWSLTAGAALGLMHGIIVSFWLVIFVAEHHPKKEYRAQGFGLALSDIGGHVFFGALIGILIAKFNLDFHVLTAYAANTGF